MWGLVVRNPYTKCIICLKTLYTWSCVFKISAWISSLMAAFTSDYCFNSGVGVTPMCCSRSLSFVFPMRSVLTNSCFFPIQTLLEYSSDSFYHYFIVFFMQLWLRGFTLKKKKSLIDYMAEEIVTFLTVSCQKSHYTDLSFHFFILT